RGARQRPLPHAPPPAARGPAGAAGLQLPHPEQPDRRQLRGGVEAHPAREPDRPAGPRRRTVAPPLRRAVRPELRTLARSRAGRLSPEGQMMKIPIERYELDNGLRVVLSEDHRQPVVGVNLWYDVGSRNERPGRTGFAHLFEHMMFQGSANVPDTQHIAHIERVGGAMNGSTWLDRTNYFETVPANWLELALWLESDRMGFLLPAM